MRTLLFIIGVAVALLAHFPVDWFVRWLRHRSDVSPRELRQQAVPVSIVGTFERLLAFFLVCLNVEGTYAILIAWMAAKLAASWQHQPISGSLEAEEADREIRAGILIALMAGTVSLIFGVVGGAIARYGLS